MNRTPAIKELRIMLDAAEFWIDAEADEEHPDPIGDACELVRDASKTLRSVEAEHAEMLNILEHVANAPTLPTDRTYLDQIRATISKVKGTT